MWPVGRINWHGIRLLSLSLLLWASQSIFLGGLGGSGRAKSGQYWENRTVLHWILPVEAEVLGKQPCLKRALRGKESTDILSPYNHHAETTSPRLLLLTEPVRSKLGAGRQIQNETRAVLFKREVKHSQYAMAHHYSRALSAIRHQVLLKSGHSPNPRKFGNKSPGPWQGQFRSLFSFIINALAALCILSTSGSWGWLLNCALWSWCDTL